MRTLLAGMWAAVCLLVGAPATWAGTPESGVYDGMLLSIRDGRVMGVFTANRVGNGREDAPQFSCAFLLRGRLAGDQAAIETWTPGDDEIVPGQLTDLGTSTIILRLHQDQDGCPMAIGLGRTEFPLTFAQSGDDWIGVAMVRTRRAVLRRAPAADTQRSPYLVEFDAVAVLARRPGWVRVRYFGGEKTVAGWLRDTDLVAERWPSKRRVE